MEEMLLYEDIESLPEEVFTLSLGVNRAKETISRLELEESSINCKFDNDIWIFKKHLNKGSVVNMDFTRANDFVFSSELTRNIKIICKCWVAELLEINYAETVSDALSILLKLFEWTQGLQPQMVDSLIKQITHLETEETSKRQSKPFSNKRKRDYINVLCNFLSYSDLPISDIYTPKLVTLKSKIRAPKGAFKRRELPPTKELVMFSDCIDRYKEYLDSSNKTETLKEIIYYYPIIIWWTLTTVIPLRASEFCLIERNCIFMDEGKYYIRLPRYKEEYAERNIQLINEFEINADMYKTIEYYLELTEPYGHTETMISYNALIAAESNSNRASIKRDKSYFTRGILKNLLNSFYDKVIHGKYDIHVTEKNRLTPNLTRHIAFVSLLMQGISPIEIARLGGHKTITAQYHYSYHVESWIDSQVFKLIKKFKQASPEMKSDKGKTKKTNVYIPDEIRLKAYEKIPKGIDPIPVKIGVCIDEFQRCETDGCMFGCNHWRISPGEFLEKEELIKEEIARKRTSLNELQAFVVNLHKQILGDEVTRMNPNTFRILKIKSKEIKEEISQLARLELTNQLGILLTGGGKNGE